MQIGILLDCAHRQDGQDVVRAVGHETGLVAQAVRRVVLEVLEARVVGKGNPANPTFGGPRPEQIPLSPSSPPRGSKSSFFGLEKCPECPQLCRYANSLASPDQPNSVGVYGR